MAKQEKVEKKMSSMKDKKGKAAKKNSEKLVKSTDKPSNWEEVTEEEGEPTSFQIML
jgi:hypothetical protein